MWLMLIPWVGVSLQYWVILTHHQQSRLGESVVMRSCGFITTCPPELLSENVFVVPHAYEKEKITFHSALL